MNSEFNVKDIQGEISGFTELRQNSSDLNILASTFEGDLLSCNFDREFRHIKLYTIASFPDYYLTTLKSINANQILIGTRDFTGNNSVILYDIEKKSEIIKHPISGICYRIMDCSEDTFCTYSFDQKVQFWKFNEKNCFHQISYKDNFRTITDNNNNIFLTGTNGNVNQITMIDKKRLNEPSVLKIEYLKYTECQLVSSDFGSYSDNFKLCYGSEDGRVLEFENSFDKMSLQNVYRAHHYNNLNLSFPINVVKYHPTFEGVIVSGGEDGKVNYFDCISQTLYKKTVYAKMPIRELGFSLDGEHLIVIYGSDQSETVDKKSKLFVIPLDETYFPPK